MIIKFFGLFILISIFLFQDITVAGRLRRNIEIDDIYKKEIPNRSYKQSFYERITKIYNSEDSNIDVENLKGYEIYINEFYPNDPQIPLKQSYLDRWWHLTLFGVSITIAIPVIFTMFVIRDNN